MGGNLNQEQLAKMAKAGDAVNQARVKQARKAETSAKGKARETRRIRKVRTALEGKREGWARHWHHLGPSQYEAGQRYLAHYEGQGAVSSSLAALDRTDGDGRSLEDRHVSKIEAAKRGGYIEAAVKGMAELSREAGMPLNTHMRAWHLATLHGRTPQEVGDTLCGEMRGEGGKLMGRELRRLTAQGLVGKAADAMANAMRGR